MAFCHPNAKAALSFALSLIAQLLVRPRPGCMEFSCYCEGASTGVSHLVERWESRYGELFSRATTSGRPTG